MGMDTAGAPNPLGSSSPHCKQVLYPPYRHCTRAQQGRAYNRRDFDHKVDRCKIQLGKLSWHRPYLHSILLEDMDIAHSWRFLLGKRSQLGIRHSQQLLRSLSRLCRNSLKDIMFAHLQRSNCHVGNYWAKGCALLSEEGREIHQDKSRKCFDPSRCTFQMDKPRCRS